jgi:hypothetical protein
MKRRDIDPNAIRARQFDNLSLNSLNLNVNPGRSPDRLLILDLHERV